VTSSEPEGHWAPGEVVLRRFRRPGSQAEGVQPCRVVRDDDRGLVVWLAAGTPVLRQVLADGRDIRDVPLSQRFDYYRHGRATRLDTWHGQGILGISGPGVVPWSVWLFWTDDWEFRGWYVNLEAPPERDGNEWATEDHILDLIVAPDRSVVWKDEDELKAAVLGRRFTDEQAEAIRRDARAAAAVVAECGAPFSDGWETWRPDPAWPVPALPEHLAASAEYR
jgi:hypothetical protein